MVKPFHALSLLVIVTTLLFLLGYITPKGIQLGTLSINTIQLSTLFETTRTNLPEVDMLSNSTLTNKKLLEAKTDSVSNSNLTPIDSILDLQFPKGADSIMAPFYNALTAIDTLGHPVHILHFGDSQIEGDRVSSAIRALFQQQFGGCGTGLLPVVDPTHTRFSHKITSSQSWIKISPATKQTKKQPFGIYCSYFERENITDNAEVIIKKTGNASSNVVQSETFTIIKYPLSDSAKEGIEVFQKDFLLEKISTGQVIDQYDLKNPISTNIVVKIQENTHPMLQAFSFDCKSGISVDNISLRGSSITDFTKMHSSFFRTVCKGLHVKLVILQFGVNVVPYEVDDYSHYEKLCFQQLSHLKKLLGNEVSVLVVGVSDMSKSENGKFTTYPKLKLIRDAQKKAALKANCAFWDLYNNMGGKNSMVTWVNAEKPLAGSDYTHFTPSGANHVGKMIYNAIIKDYENYKK